MSVTDSWVAGREAVLAFAQFCLDQRWVFAEVPEQSDFGKDGYVDLTSEGGKVMGNCFAVQVKGGRSRRRKHGLKIDANDKQRSQWSRSTMPVVGIAFDPDARSLYWLDLTAVLQQNGESAPLLAPFTQGLNSEAEVRRFTKYIQSTTHQSGSVLELGSSELDRQLFGVFSCHVIGREDGRALIMLRRMLFFLEHDAQMYAVSVLARAVYHPDIFHTHQTMIEPAARALLQPHLRWSVDEMLSMFRLTGDGDEDDGGMGRGTVGQTVFHLLIEDPDHIEKIDQTVVRAAHAGDEMLASWALLVAVYLAEDDGRAKLTELLGRAPQLQGVWATPQVVEILEENGWLSLFD